MERERVARKRVVLVGRPNVGKSSIMHALTGRRVTISNYAGTTVEVASGCFQFGSMTVEVVDTPGVYSLGQPLHTGSDAADYQRTEEQRATSSLIKSSAPDLMVVVIDAANLESHLPLAIETLDFKAPVIVALNQMDRAETLGLCPDARVLEEALGVRVVPVSAPAGKGIERLRACIVSALRRETRKATAVSKGRTSGLEPPVCGDGEQYVAEDLNGRLSRTLAARRIASDALRRASQVLEGQRCPHSRDWAPVRGSSPSGQAFEAILDDPCGGIAISLVLLYLSFAAIVGLTRVGEMLLGAPLLRAADSFISMLLDIWPMRDLTGTPWAQVLRAGVREGMLLPISVVMPAMVGVYIVLAILEDSGFLARLTVSGERLMNLVDLPGEAAVPLILAFGCRAPAVLGSRTVPGSPFRYKATTLICLGIPCASGLAMTSAMIARFGANPTVVWGSVGFGFCFLALVLRACPGLVCPSSKNACCRASVPGSGTFGMGRRGGCVSFATPVHGLTDQVRMATFDRCIYFTKPVPVLATEIPPLRMPMPANVALKTWARMSSFFEHVLPMLFLVGFGARALLEVGIWRPLTPFSDYTLALFGIQARTLTGIMFTAVQKYLAPAILLTLPLEPREATIAATMSAMSIPCLPVSILASKELGPGYLARIWLLGAALSAGAGLALNFLLPR